MFLQRIATITSSLQYNLEGSFVEGLEARQVDVLRQCLRTYATIDKTKDAENLFRQHVVKEYMEEVRDGVNPCHQEFPLGNMKNYLYFLFLSQHWEGGCNFSLW